MTSRISRQTFNRRDRRLAKASDWNRPGKANPKKVGHGGSGESTDLGRTNKSFGLKSSSKKTKHPWYGSKMPKEDAEPNTTTYTLKDSLKMKSGLK